MPPKLATVALSGVAEKFLGAVAWSPKIKWTPVVPVGANAPAPGTTNWRLFASTG